LVSIIILASFAPSFIMLIGAMLIIFMKDRINRKFLNFFIFIFALLLNSLLLVYYWIYDIVERDLYLNLETGTFILIECILCLSIIILLFSQEENAQVDNENILDGIIIIIILGLIGTLITSNIIAIFSCFIIVVFLMGTIFYFGDYPKEFRLLKSYFFGSAISVVLIFISIYLIYLNFNTLILTELSSMQISKEINTIISLFLLLAIGIPCGLIPFSIYHLRNFFRDTSYSLLFLYFIFNFTSLFLLIRVLNCFALDLIIFSYALLPIAAIGLIIPLIYILTELFSSLDGNTFSIKKLYGYSICSDFNLCLLLLSFLSFLPSDLSLAYMNGIIFYYLMIIAIKTLIFFTYFPVMLETDDDNLKLLGELWAKYRNFGIIFFISGLIISLPLNLLTINTLITIYTSDSIANSLNYTINLLIFALYIIYLGITLVFISISFNQIYFSDKPRYIEREQKTPITFKHYLPIIIVIILIGILSILFLFIEDIFYNVFSTFFLIIE